MQGPRRTALYLKDGSEEQPQGAGSDSHKDLVNTDAPSSSPGCPVMPPSHNDPHVPPAEKGDTGTSPVPSCLPLCPKRDTCGMSIERTGQVSTRQPCTMKACATCAEHGTPQHGVTQRGWGSVSRLRGLGSSALLTGCWGHPDPAGPGFHPISQASEDTG